MVDKKALDEHFARLGPGLFVVVLVMIVLFFRWFMYGG